MSTSNTMQNVIMELQHDNAIKIRQIENLERNYSEFK